MRYRRTYVLNKKYLKIKFYDGNQVEDKVAWGLGHRLLCIHSSFVFYFPPSLWEKTGAFRISYILPDIYGNEYKMWKKIWW